LVWYRVGVRRWLALGLLLLSTERVGADDDRQALLQRGHRKKVIGASLIAVGSVFDAATTALTFAGLTRGGWSLAPKDTTDTALLWSGVAGNFVLDTVLTVGIVVYCDGGDLMRRAR
jgi:hypothetical protein